MTITDQIKYKDAVKITPVKGRIIGRCFLKYKFPNPQAPFPNPLAKIVDPVSPQQGLECCFEKILSNYDLNAPANPIFADPPSLVENRFIAPPLF